MSLDIQKNLKAILTGIPDHVQLVAVSKTKPNHLIEEAYSSGQRVFGENKVQELVDKQAILPKDIQWHMIGHLQRNKVKYIAPFISLIHGVDTIKLLKEVNKEAQKNDRVIDCLLQVHIAQEESKFGFSTPELEDLFASGTLSEYQNIRIVGLMGMATNTEEKAQVASEFNMLHELFKHLSSLPEQRAVKLKILSMGMSGDYQIAIENGSNMIRVGSSIFGARQYPAH